jgi:hypothetical protein
MEARNRQLPEWFNRIGSGQIRLPRFQRFQAWGHGEVGDLLEAVLRGLPAGATLVLEVGDRELFVSRPMPGAPAPSERVTEQLLDGQQRLTALWRSFHDDYEDRIYLVYFDVDEEHDGGEIPFVFGQARWSRDGRPFPLWADDPKEVAGRGYFPLRLLRPGDVGKEVDEWCDAATGQDAGKGKELSHKIHSLRERVTSYNVPFLSLPVLTPRDVAVNVFIKMNTTSVRLTPFDIVVAEVEEETGQSLHDLVAALKGSVPEVEAYTTATDLILSTAALREDRPPTQVSYQRLDLQRLVREWDSLTAGVAWMVDFLERESVFDGERLPTTAVLPVLAALAEAVPGALDARGNAETLLRRYLWRSFFTRRYENAAATRALQDFRGLRAVLRDGGGAAEIPILDESQYSLPTVDELRLASWPKARDILGRAVLALSIRAGALDLADGSPASRGNLARREYHHLFPDHLLTTEGQLLPRDSYRALNCALVTWNTNRNISAKEPVKYLRERVELSALGEGEIRARLASHLVPFDALAVGPYEQMADRSAAAAEIRSDYEDFLAARGELLLRPMELLCEGRRWPEPGV